MWVYQKKLQYPVNIKQSNPAIAKLIMSQLGGPHGEKGAADRYLQQRYSMPYASVVGMLTDIGTEELAHQEIVSSIITQLMRNVSISELEESGMDAYFIDHTTSVYPQSAGGVPFSANSYAVAGDAIADLSEDLAAEGTITKEQPVFSIPQKALFHAVFRTFRVLAPNRRLRPHKNNKSQKTIGQAVFKEKYDRLTTGLSDRQ